MQVILPIIYASVPHQKHDSFSVEVENKEVETLPSPIVSVFGKECPYMYIIHLDKR